MPRLIVEAAGVKKPGGAFESFMEGRDLTFYSLSRKSGITENTLRRIRNGLSVRKVTVRKLHRFFHVSRQVILDLLKRDGVAVVR